MRTTRGTFTYRLLPNREDLHHTPMLEEFYLTWQQKWSQTLSELNSCYSPTADDFLRQKILASLCLEDRIVAFQTHSVFDLNSAVHRSHSYLQRFGSAGIERMLSEGARRVMTIEYLYVEPAYRKFASGMSLAATLIEVSVNLLDSLHVDSLVAVTRNDRGINTIFYGLGAVPVVQNAMLHNVSVDCVWLTRSHATRRRPFSRECLSDALWATRAQPYDIPVRSKHLRCLLSSNASSRDHKEASV